jgi:hypothetical protein
MHKLFEKLDKLFKEGNLHVTEFVDRRGNEVFYTFYTNPNHGGSFFSANEQGLSGLHVLPNFPKKIPFPEDFYLEKIEDVAEKANLILLREIFFLQYLNEFSQSPTMQ